MKTANVKATRTLSNNVIVGRLTAISMYHKALNGGTTDAADISKHQPEDLKPYHGRYSEGLAGSSSPGQEPSQRCGQGRAAAGRPRPQTPAELQAPECALDYPEVKPPQQPCNSIKGSGCRLPALLHRSGHEKGRGGGGGGGGGHGSAT